MLTKIVILNILIIFCTLSLHSFAEIPTDALEKLFYKQQQAKEFQASFVQKKSIKSIDVILESNGKMKVATEKIIWEVFSPSHLTVIIAKDKITITSGDDPKNEKTETYDRNQIGNKNFSYIEDLFSVWKLEWEALQKRYSVKSYDLKAKTILLAPNTAGGNMQSIEIKLGANDLLQTVKLYEKSGDYMVIDFSKYVLQGEQIH